MKLTLVRLTRLLAMTLAVAMAIPASARAASDALRTGLEEKTERQVADALLATGGLEEIVYYELPEAAAEAYRKRGDAKTAEWVTERAAIIASRPGLAAAAMAVMTLPARMVLTWYATPGVYDDEFHQNFLIDIIEATPELSETHIERYEQGQPVPPGAIVFKLSDDETPVPADAVPVTITDIQNFSDVLQRVANHHLSPLGHPAIGRILGAFVRGDQVFLFA